MKPKIIKSSHENAVALARIDKLLEMSVKPGTELGDELELLVKLTEDYEQSCLPIEPPTAIEAIRFRMDQEGGMSDKNWLTARVNSITNEPLKKTCLYLLEDERFFVSPAAAKKHQAWTGGLAEHTRQVMDIALAMASAECLRGIVSTDIIIVGVLWHDYGKIWDYKKNTKQVEADGTNAPEWVYDRHRWTTRHLSRSYAVFYKTALECGCTEDQIEEVGHCILSHHGRTEYGSPVTPMTPEASIIHFSDSVDAFHVGKPHVFRTPRAEWKSAKE